MDLAYHRPIRRKVIMSSTSWRSVPLPRGWGAICYSILARDPVCRWGIAELGEDGICGQPSTEVDHIGAARITILHAAWYMSIHHHQVIDITAPRYSSNAFATAASN